MCCIQELTSLLMVHACMFKTLRVRLDAPLIQTSMTLILMGIYASHMLPPHASLCEFHITPRHTYVHTTLYSIYTRAHAVCGGGCTGQLVGVSLCTVLCVSVCAFDDM